MRAPLLALLLLLAAAAAGAAAAVPPDLSDDPLDRGVLLALPSVYRVEATIRVDALRLRDGTRIAMPPRGREIPEVGTGVVVAPDGWLVTAAHVAAPDREAMARLAYQTLQAFRGRPHADAQAARDWVARTGAVALPGRVVRTVVTPARVGADPADDREYRGLETHRSPAADLALVRIHAPTAPAVRLDEARSSGTPVATIGFSGDDRLGPDGGAPGDPTVRRGAIRRGATAEPDSPRERAVVVISSDVRSGDSGGPVVDEEGAVRGVVIQRADSGGGVAEGATEVRRLLESQGLAAEPGPAADAFRAGMAALWRLDLEAAQTGFTRTLQADPSHALAGRELMRARALASVPFTLRAEDRREGILLGVAVLAIAAAAACALALALPALGRSRDAPGGR